MVRPRPGNRVEGRVIRILERNTDIVVGTLQKSRQELLHVIPDDPRFPHCVYVKPGAATLASLLENHARAIFPAGAPPWYSQFSNAVYTNIHSAAAGSESVASAINAIASTVKGLGG